VREERGLGFSMMNLMLVGFAAARIYAVYILIYIYFAVVEVLIDYNSKQPMVLRPCLVSLV
jgi:hypothetical protein